MNPGDETTITWTFSEPVNSFIINILGGDVKSQPIPLDESGRIWTARVSGAIPKEFSSIDSFFISPLKMEKDVFQTFMLCLVRFGMW